MFNRVFECVPPILLTYATAVVLSICRRMWRFWLRLANVFTANTPPKSSRQFMCMDRSLLVHSPPDCKSPHRGPHPPSQQGGICFHEHIRNLGKPFCSTYQDDPSTTADPAKLLVPERLLLSMSEMSGMPRSLAAEAGGKHKGAGRMA